MGHVLKNVAVLFLDGLLGGHRLMNPHAVPRGSRSLAQIGVAGLGGEVVPGAEIADPPPSRRVVVGLDEDFEGVNGLICGHREEE